MTVELLSLFYPAQWKLRGRCSNTPLPIVDHLFFPVGLSGKAVTRRREAAQAFCNNGCPVIEECREDALKTREVFNAVRGGLLPKELQDLRAQQ